MRPFNANKVALSGLALLFFTQLAAGASAVLGIDLGQEFIKAALVKPGIPLEIVLTKDSKRKEASVIGFKPPHNPPAEGEFPYADRLYGGDALAVAPRFPHDTYPNLKQLLGLFVDDPTVTAYSKRYPALNILPSNVRNTVAFKSNFAPAKAGEYGVWTVEELLAMQLESVKKNAESMAGKGWKIKDAVFAIPAYYTPEERQALTTAAELAGLKVMALISDGVAVGINYATTRTFPVEDKPQHHIIYDMGAGSTTASLIKIQGKSVKDIGKYMKNIIEVSLVSVGFNRKLGGDAFTEKIANHLLEDFASSPKGKKLNEDVEKVKELVSGNGRAAAKLWKEATRVRHILSANSEAVGSIESFIEDIDFRSKKVLRSEFEEYLQDYTDAITLPVRHCLAVSNLELKDVDSVILHGGAVRTPFVTKTLEELVGADKIAKNVNADEAAVLGATFHGAGLSNSFKVKEIRAVDAFEYPISIQYSQEGKVKKTKDTIFHGRDALGKEKTVTFKRITDFTFSDFHITPPRPGKFLPEPIYINEFTTKNLTESTTKLKESYNCTDKDILTKATMKLNEVNGIPIITSIWAECEALVPVEVKKVGIVDGVKNFFGLNKDKKDTKSASKSKTDSKTESSSASSSESSSASESKESVAAAAGDKDQKVVEKDEPKLEKKVVKIPVKFVTAKIGIPALPSDELKALSEKLSGYTKYDEDKTAREEARNVLEAFIYKTQNLLEDAEYVLASTEEERKKLAEQLSQAMEWLYEEGAVSAVKVVKEKLKSLKDLEKPISHRKEEASKRPELIKNLREALESGKNMIDNMRNPPKPVATATAENGETPVMETLELSEELKGDLTKLEKYYNEVNSWLEENLSKQDALKPHEDPILSTKKVQDKMTDLNAKIYKIFEKQLEEVRKNRIKILEEQNKLEKAQRAAAEAAKSAESASASPSDSSASASSSSSSAAPEKSAHDEL